ncbi:hypothetical protein [Pseudoalteromonas luteoviolacea]|nr:hypothetical protein [Pseudoalteromonas luteoviolacea]MBQ4877058.1 hypothetical protein [Pseudoalteromonas luteoviolacea]MBQ4905919.1 hypothetical protein [Pseudoalteromonas luteoviolacea]
MIESAFSISFQNNILDHKLIVVCFISLAFILFLIFPSIWWSISALCYAGYLFALKHTTKIMPVSGDLVLIEQDAWVQLSDKEVIFEGVIRHAQKYASIITFELYSDCGKKRRLMFIDNAMDPDSWCHLSRIALQVR